MAIIRSTQSNLEGLRSLQTHLERQLERGRPLTVTETVLASYLWSVGVTSQYPQKVMGEDPGSSDLAIEHVVGLIANTRI